MTAMPTTDNPFAEAFDAYYNAGWRSIFQLPYGQKFPPPTGYTGRDPAIPSYADLMTWADDNKPYNIGLRLPPGVVGLDVDDYNDKGGGATLATLISGFGPLPPTCMSSSRGDGISGIRLYRVDGDVELVTAIRHGIEIIQKHHRYVVAWPSVHPEGGIYQWIDERTGETMVSPPKVADLPYLPAAWVNMLAAAARKETAKADLTGDQARAILEQMPTGEPCRHILAATGKALTGKDRHDAYNEAVLSVVGAGRRGCPGAAAALDRLQAAFVAEIAHGPNKRATDSEARQEYRRSIEGALALVADEPQGGICPDNVIGYVGELLHDTTAPTTATDVEGADQDEYIPLLDPIERDAQRRLGDMLAIDRARELHAQLRLGQRPGVTPVDLPTFLAQPDEDAAYRVDQLWPAEGRVLLVAQAKAGKTTMVVANLLPTLLGGPHAFLGKYKVTPVTGRIVYINIEVGEATLRRWLKKARVPASDRVSIINLRGKASALGINSEAGRAHWAKTLRDLEAEIVVLDPVAPVLAALGLDENSNTDVATFWSWWGETLKAGGVVDDLVVHHAGHAGERSRGASRLLDEPDAIWTLTVQGRDDDGGRRYLTAMGRDVHLDRHELSYNDATGALTIGGNAQHLTMRDHQQHFVNGVIEKLRSKGGSMSLTEACGGGGGRLREKAEWLKQASDEGVLELVSGRRGRIVQLPTPPKLQTSDQLQTTSEVTTDQDFRLLGSKAEKFEVNADEVNEP